MTAVVPSGGRTVVGVDGSEGSIDALRWAARLAATFGTGLDVVTTWSFPANFGAGALPGDWNPEADAKSAQATAIATAFPGTEPGGLQRIVREGNPARILLDASCDAGMLVVGSRGHGGFYGLLIGSVSSYCAEHATCPVLVVHHRPADRP